MIEHLKIGFGVLLDSFTLDFNDCYKFKLIIEEAKIVNGHPIILETTDNDDNITRIEISGIGETAMKCIKKFKLLSNDPNSITFSIYLDPNQV